MGWKENDVTCIELNIYLRKAKISEIYVLCTIFILASTVHLESIWHVEYLRLFLSDPSQKFINVFNDSLVTYGVISIILVNK